MSLGNPSVEPALAPIPQIPEHELLQPIASGAYGQVWLARNALGTLRAVKIVRRDRFERAEDFEREFRGLQRFEPVSRTHEALVDVLQIGRQDDWFYYVMELADDASAKSASDSARLNETLSYAPLTLRQHIRERGCLPANEVIDLGHGMASALAHLHSNGLLHRDVKPSNILLVKGRPKLADAGLVAAVDDARSLVGTAGYIPPEGPGTPQADIYSLGKVLYEAAFGKDRQEFPQLPAELASRPDHSALLEINEIIAKACAANPKQRYPQAGKLVQELEGLRGGNSVRRKRRLEYYWLMFKRAAVAAGLLALLVTALMLAIRRRGDTDFQSTNQEVNTLVEQGNYAVLGQTPERLEKALAYFQKALDIEPKFVPAQYGLFRAYVAQGDSPERMTNLRTAAGRLMALNPSLAESHIASVYLKWYDSRYREAVGEARLATVSQCRSKWARGDARATLGYCLLMTGHPSEALDEYRLAESLLPISPEILQQLGNPFFVQGKFKEALEYYRRSTDLEPRNWGALDKIGRVYEELGDFDKAIDAYLKAASLSGTDDVEMRRRFEALRLAALNGRAQGYHRKALEFALGASKPDSYAVAACYAHLHETEKAYEWLAVAERDNSIGDRLMFDPCWDHTDKRFEAIAKRVGLMW
jgi:serine/threonine protein kinase